jgi:methanogenic corrinoid protein MtbC1
VGIRNAVREHQPPTKSSPPPRVGQTAPAAPSARAAVGVASRSSIPGSVLALIARRVAAESDAAVQRALRSASGRLARMGFRASSLRSPRSRVAAIRPHTSAPLPLRSIVAPLVAWTHSSADGEGASEVATSLMDMRMAREVLYAHVVEPCARDLGDECADELCTDIEVTLALVRLQTLVRCLGASAPHTSFVPRSVMVAAAPEELHGLGMAIASECFLSAGWDVAEAPGADDATIASAMHRRRFDALVLSLSGANHRMERLTALSHTISRARSAYADGRLVVLVTGRDFTDGHASARDVGADAACASAVDAPHSASAIIDALGRGAA